MNRLLHFPVHNIRLTTKAVHHSKEHEVGLETTWIFCIQLFLYAVSAPEEDGNIQANRYAYKHKQAVT